MVLALMESCGLYDGSGAFAAKIGIPGKSGVGGGILCTVPAKLGIATYGPGLDAAGNSTFGLFALEKIAAEENLSIVALASGPICTVCTCAPDVVVGLLPAEQDAL